MGETYAGSRALRARSRPTWFRLGWLDRDGGCVLLRGRESVVWMELRAAWLKKRLLARCEMRDGGRASKSWCYDIVNGDGKAAKFQLAGERNPSLRVCAEPRTAGALAALSPLRLGGKTGAGGSCGQSGGSADELCHRILKA